MKGLHMSDIKSQIEQCEVDIRALEDNKRKLEQELKYNDRNLPSLYTPGKIFYSKKFDRYFMIAYTAGNSAGLTIISGDFVGCFNKVVCNKTFSSCDLLGDHIRDNTNLRYVGTFDEVFIRKGSFNG